MGLHPTYIGRGKAEILGLAVRQAVTLRGMLAAESPSLVDPDLARIIEAWPRLPDPIRRAILALIG